jgi:hypothetical protein
MPEKTLYRLAAWCGVIGGAGVLFNTARRTGLVPENGLTEALAPLASLLLLLFLVALYLAQRERTGAGGLVGFGLTFAGLTGLFAIEFVGHGVFQFLDQSTVDDIVAGPTRGYFLAVAVTFIVGVLVLGAVQLRARILPAPATAMFAVGYVAAGLRGLVPEGVYVGGLAVGAVATIWLALALRATVPSATTDEATRAPRRSVAS